MKPARLRAALFVNPAAASGLRRDGGATEVLARHFELAIHETRSAEELSDRARAEARGGCPVIIAGGGDGTVNRVINAIAGTDAALGVLPLGTANDLARNLGIPGDAVAAAERLATSAIRRIDLIEVGGNLFSTAGGMGVVTRCADAANRIKASRGPAQLLARMLGNTIYTAVTAPIIFLGRGNSWDAALEWEDATGTRNKLSLRTHGIFFTNQSTIGGDLTLPVAARNDDGEMDVCVIPSGSRIRLARIALALKRARPLASTEMRVFRATRATLTADRPFAVLGDGEIFRQASQVEWKIRRHGLAILA